MAIVFVVGTVVVIRLSKFKMPHPLFATSIALTCIVSRLRLTTNASSFRRHSKTRVFVMASSRSKRRCHSVGARRFRAGTDEPIAFKDDDDVDADTDDDEGLNDADAVFVEVSGDGGDATFTPFLRQASARCCGWAKMKAVSCEAITERAALWGLMVG